MLEGAALMDEATRTTSVSLTCCSLCMNYFILVLLKMNLLTRVIVEYHVTRLGSLTHTL